MKLCNFFLVMRLLKVNINIKSIGLFSNDYKTWSARCTNTLMTIHVYCNSSKGRILPSRAFKRHHAEFSVMGTPSLPTFQFRGVWCFSSDESVCPQSAVDLDSGDELMPTKCPHSSHPSNLQDRTSARLLTSPSMAERRAECRYRS